MTGRSVAGDVRSRTVLMMRPVIIIDRRAARHD